MKIVAKAARGKHTDVRDACSKLQLEALHEDELNFLTRLYRHIIGIETDAETTRAIETLSRPIERYTRADVGVFVVGGPEIVMVGRRGTTR